MGVGMSSKTLRFLVGVVGTAAAAIFAGPANAGYYGSHYDPVLSNSFNGDDVFFVPDPPSPCLDPAIPGFQHVNGEADPCTGVALVKASLDATDVNNNTAHLSFTGFDTQDITGMVLGSEEPLLRGINSDRISLTCSGNNILCDDFTWFISFESGLPPPELFTLIQTEFYDPLAGLDNKVLLWQQCTDGCTEPDIFATAGDVTFAQVPEPGTLVLILGGLAAGWLSRKRKVAALR
ncbi:MAG: PEP-CTERM sorting domain-containing protein [Burkholderiales bacterium]